MNNKYELDLEYLRRDKILTGETDAEVRRLIAKYYDVLSSLKAIQNKSYASFLAQLLTTDYINKVENTFWSLRVKSSVISLIGDKYSRFAEIPSKRSEKRKSK